MFIPGPNKRTKAFDRLVENAAELAKQLDPSGFHPEVRPVVRAMRNIEQHIFLPNVRNGVAEVPLTKRGKDGYGLVPAFPGETITVGHSFATSTPTRLRIEQEHVPEVPIRALEMIHKYFYDMCKRTPATTIDFTNIDPTAEIGYTFTSELPIEIEYDGRDMVVHAVSRPLITVAVIPETHPDGPTLLHEYVHGYDAEHNWDGDPEADPQTVLARYRTELRAYHAGRVIARQTGMFPNGLTLEQADQSATMLVENIRTQVHKGSEQAFEPTPELIQRLTEAGFYLKDAQ